MTRDEALALLQEHVKQPNLVKHCLATEAVMRALAKRLNQDGEKWGLAGLLHDLDVEVTNADLKVHGLKTEEILRARGLDPEIVEAVVRHNELACNRKRETAFQHALAAGETVTGIIVASALILPDKKLNSVKPESVRRRMKEKGFARSVNRETIKECEKLGLALEEFLALAVQAMQGIAAELGL